ncbi:MAG: alkaline phosphatase family protein [Holophagales bacterium]|nr:alkaline phosphatase family protein [Holophagales bacterium]
MPRNRMKSSRLVLAAFGALLLSAVAPLRAQEVKGRVVVLGFDGADHRLVSQFIAEGKLPNLQKLATQGSFSPLRPTIPAQTPVSWSTFSTGLSPGRTQIFDFLKRDPKTYRPEFAIATEGKKSFLLGRWNRAGSAAGGALLAFLVVFAIGRLAVKKTLPAAVVALVLAAPAAFFSWRFGGLLPQSLQTVQSNRQGTPFWEVAGAKGIKSVVLHVPVTFPAEDYAEGRLLSGLGVPDVRGRIGTPSYYTSDPFFAPKNKNEFSVELVRLESNVGTIQTEVFGPYNKLFGEPPVIRTPMTLTVLPDGGRLRIAPKGSEPVTLKPGEWSPWVTFTFEFNALVKLSGIGRFHLAAIAPEIQLYLSPINFNPLKLPPGIKITAPNGLAKDLAKRFGLYKTMGWSIDTWSMSEETIDEPTFLDDVTHTVQQYRKMMDGLLAEKDVRLFVQVYEFTDRVGHVMWRFLDPTHPAYDAEKAARFAPSVERNYVQMDNIVGDALKELGPDDLLLVCSDHGFTSWRRSINYNTWLVQQGFMVLKGGDEKQADLEQLFGQGEFWPNVDWSRTKAYSMGLGEIYVNVRGREAQGIVEPGAEYDALRQEIRTKLTSLVDEATGRSPIERVYTREEAYGSFDPDLIPDLFVGNSEGYRVSWQASLGVVTPELYEENSQVWSGDHCSVDPDVVPGILFSSRPLRKEPRPNMADVPATIYKALGLTPPEKLDGVPLF